MLVDEGGEHLGLQEGGEEGEVGLHLLRQKGNLKCGDFVGKNKCSICSQQQDRILFHLFLFCHSEAWIKITGYQCFGSA